MSGKCVAYWRAIDKGKECGAPKLGTITRKFQDEYRKGIVPDLVAAGLKEDDVYENLHYSILNQMYPLPPLLKIKRESPLRKKLLDILFEALASKRSLKGKDKYFKEIAEKFPELDTRKWGYDEWMLHFGKDYRFRKVMGVITSERNHNPPKATPQDPEVQHKRWGEDTPTSISRKLSNVITAGQRAILQDMVSYGFGDNEYAAFCIALKWASEKLDTLENEDNVIIGESG